MCTLLCTDNEADGETLTLNGQRLANSKESGYLGVTVTAGGMDPTQSFWRIKNGKRILHVMKRNVLHGGITNSGAVLKIWNTHIRLMVAYGIHPVPLTKILTNMLAVSEKR